MPLSSAEVREIVASAAVSAQKPIGEDLPEVWPSARPPLDTSSIDMISETLRAKLFNKVGENEPLKALRQIFELPDHTIDAEAFTRGCSKKLNFVGYEDQIRQLFRRFDVDRTGRVDVLTIYSILNKETKSRAVTAIGKVREILTKRSGGLSSLKTLGLQFKLLDGDASGTLSKEELDKGLEKFMRGYRVLLAPQEIDALFKYFDADGSNSVTYDEFLRGIRGDMNEHRLEFVRKAFKILDINGDGKLSLEEIAQRYNVSANPSVKSGKISERDALRAFIAHWHTKSDGTQHNVDHVTLAEFTEYYQWVSASIDEDPYFELMMRNAWHISGGAGASANTTCLRVLVTHEDGRQTVEELTDDFDLARDDMAAIKAKLAAQGIRAKEISLKD